MKALVTGGAGFVGSHLVVRLLRAGVRVAVLDDFSIGTRESLDDATRIGLRPDDVFIDDITTGTAAAVLERWRPDVVFHLAAQARVADSIRDPHRDGTVNVLGTVNMLRAAANAGVRRFVAASSGGTVYGQLPEGSQRLPESAPMRPISPYGAAKAATEHYLLVYRDLYGLPTTSIRLGNVYGPRCGGNSGADVVCRFVSAAVVGAQPSICGDGAQTRDFVHVSDAAEAFLLAGYQTDGGAFNVSSGEECAITALAQLVCAAFGMPFEPRYEPARPGEVRRVCLDTTRARRELGWRPTITLAEGIGELVDRARTGPLESAGARVAAGGGTGR